MSKQVGYIDTLITEVPLEFGLSAGVRQKITSSGMVSTYEEHEARLTRGYSIKDWYDLDPYERAMCVAQLRIDRAIHNQQSEAEIRDSRAKMNKGKKA